MDYDDNYINIDRENNINMNTKNNAGFLPYYTLNQVASVLNEDESRIRYYTNLFDEILKIEIISKEFRYTNSDMDKLKFLITLKNKGMTIKEIEEYCKELPLDDDEVIKSVSSSISIGDLTSILNKNNEKLFNGLKSQLLLEVQEMVDLRLKTFTDNILEKQNEYFTTLEKNLSTELAQSFNKKLEDSFKNANDTNTNFLNEYENLINDKLTDHKKELDSKLNSAFNEFTDKSAHRDEILIDEIKRFKDIFIKAYTMQNEVELLNSNPSFFQRIFSSK